MSTSPTDVAAALGAFALPTLSDAAGDAARLIPSLRPLGRGVRLAGPAFTVAGVAGDNLALHRALHHCPAGSVVVATVQGSTSNGHWGGLMARGARERGILGLVIDGAVRDADEMTELPFPVFAAGVHPRRGNKVVPGELNVPITCAGVAVHPGDLVFGDEHGVLVLPAESAPAVLERTNQVTQREATIVAGLKRGESLSSLMGIDVS